MKTSNKTNAPRSSVNTSSQLVDTELRYLNTAATLLYNYNKEDCVLTNGQALPIFDTYNTRINSQIENPRVVSLSLEFANEEFYVGGKNKQATGIDMIDYINTLAKVEDGETLHPQERAKFVRDSKWEFRFPSGYHAAYLHPYGCGWEQSQHSHSNVTLEDLALSGALHSGLNKYDDNSGTIDVQFMVQSEKGRFSMFDPIRDMKVENLTPVDLPSCWFTPEQKNSFKSTQAKGTILKELQEKHSDIGTIYVTMSSFVEPCSGFTSPVPAKSIKESNLGEKLKWFSSVLDPVMGKYAPDFEGHELLQNIWAPQRHQQSDKIRLF